MQFDYSENQQGVVGLHKGGTHDSLASLERGQRAKLVQADPLSD